MSSSVHVPSGDARDIFARLKTRNTSRDACEQLKILLCNSDLSAQSTHEHVHNAISYIATHSSIFTEQQVFSVFDSALANASFTTRQENLFLKLANAKSSTGSGLQVFPNLKDPAVCQGTYVRLMGLLSSNIPLQCLKSDLFNALRSIASQKEMFTDEQYLKIAECAIANEAFTEVQKEQLRVWKERRPGVRTGNDHVEHSPTYASVLTGSGSSRLRVNLYDPTCRQEAYMSLVEMLCTTEPLEISKFELLDAIEAVGSQPEYFTSDQFFLLADCAGNHQAFTEHDKERIQTWKTNVGVAPRVPFDGAVKTKAMARDGDAHSVGIRASQLFQKLKDPTACQETYKMVLKLVRRGGSSSLPNYRSDIYNAIRSIGSQPERFTDEQFFTIINCAMTKHAFTDAQKRHFMLWKSRSRKKRQDKNQNYLPADRKINSNTIEEKNDENGHGGQHRLTYTIEDLQAMRLTAPREFERRCTVCDHEASSLEVNTQAVPDPAHDQEYSSVEPNVISVQNTALNCVDSSDSTGMWWKAVLKIWSIFGGSNS